MADKSNKLNTPKLVTAHARSLHISPRKMRLVTNLVKSMPVEEALVQLQFTNKKAAGMLVKLLKSAVANAEHNFSIKPEDLYIKTLTCDMGQTMKRSFPRARGSAFIIRRKLAHVNVVLEERISKGGKKSRLVLPKKAKKDEPLVTREGSAGKPDQNSENSLDQTPDAKPKAFKTEEQVKMNKVQQKRRMFNRKTGV
jgi:large subunit ribosomal protein L22